MQMRVAFDSFMIVLLMILDALQPIRLKLQLRSKFVNFSWQNEFFLMMVYSKDWNLVNKMSTSDWMCGISSFFPVILENISICVFSIFEQLWVKRPQLVQTWLYNNRFYTLTIESLFNFVKFTKVPTSNCK